MKQANQILIRKLCLVFVVILLASSAWAQQTISGKVTDDAGESLPGVAVVLQGTTTGTVTDIDGHYSLQVPDGGTLLFSFVGMQSANETINGRTTIDVTMKVDAIGLEEVVAVGYGVQKKATLTGSVGNVKAEEMLQRPAANSTELLQGQVAGLYTLQTTGLPGADGTKLNIRGYGNNPLVLIDGIEGSLGQVDPNDIESISVLKDASAAVYGARAGNGVILVTTKRGTDKPSQITYHGNVSFTAPTFLPDLVEARKWAELLNESGLNPDDYSPAHVHYDSDTKRLINTMDDSDYYGYDWDEALYRDWTPQQQHNISATGGTNKIKYFVSAGYVDQSSVFTSGDYNFNRYNIRSNIDAQVKENLTVSVDFAYRSSRIDKANFGVDDMYNSLQTAKPVYPYYHEEDPTRAASSGFLQRSPYHQTFKDFSGFQDNRDKVLQGALELKYNVPFVTGLVAKARLNYEEALKWNKTVSQPYDVWEYDPVAASEGSDPWVKWGTQNANSMKVYSNRSTELLPQISLQYDKIIGDHTLKAMVVGETWSYKWTSLQGSRKDILSFEAPYLIYASEEGKDNAENLQTNGNVGVTERARASVIGRINYDYKGKYMAEFSMRADASGEYPPKGRWGYFPSVSAGWRISEEAFMKDNFSNLNNLKIRGSYGILGNDAVSSFDYLTGYTISTDYYVFGASPAPVIASAGLANPNITWETMKMSNVGIDGTFWDGLFGFEVDGFYRLREDILAQPTEQVPSTFGANLPRTNLNKRDNRGFEITLTHSNKIGDFSYDISPMYAWTRGKYVELDEDVLPTTGDLDAETLEFNKLWNERYVNEGQWDNRYWGYVSDGFFMNQEQIDNHVIDQDQAENQTIKVGDIIYKDLNGDNMIDWRDQKVIAQGSTNTDNSASLPNTMFGLDMGAQWKGLGVRMLWQGAADYVVVVGGSASAPFSNESIPLSQHYDYRAIIGQDGNGQDYITNPDDFKLPPVTQNGRTANNGKTSDFWTYDAAYLRLKNINISYTIPKSLLEKVGFSKCVVYFSGTNLFTISNLDIWKKSFDPEIIGANNRDYPPVKTMTFGLRLTL
ncbi:SusC/RagA family TonB-linked outer membrane protein [Draconibacterium mangrovi]|uniref:SusC/RagA family TonB-linked outer membrane protein n=1 Tax=Draconibacterium mangrovi TaxID=2697469 RepID=UPI0013D0F849|nr:TonB-dependent receptor [Draconibacterium mangrovi]